MTRHKETLAKAARLAAGVLFGVIPAIFAASLGLELVRRYLAAGSPDNAFVLAIWCGAVTVAAILATVGRRLDLAIALSAAAATTALLVGLERHAISLTAPDAGVGPDMLIDYSMFEFVIFAAGPTLLALMKRGEPKAGV